MNIIDIQDKYCQYCKTVHKVHTLNVTENTVYKDKPENYVAICSYCSKENVCFETPEQARTNDNEIENIKKSA